MNNWARKGKTPIENKTNKEWIAQVIHLVEHTRIVDQKSWNNSILKRIMTCLIWNTHLPTGIWEIKKTKWGHEDQILETV